MDVKALAELSHITAIDKGWWNPPKTFGEIIALCHSELSEALEHFREHHDPTEVWVDESGKPDGVPVELADCIIRIGDLCVEYGIDLEEAIRIKMEYNKTRPYRHGGKRL